MGKREKDWIKTYLEYEKYSEPPTLYKEWVAMSVIAASLQRKCKVPWGGEGRDPTFFPNLFIVLIGPSGKCRKGMAMATGKKFLSSLGIKTTAEAITREALIREIANSVVTEVTKEDNVIMHSSLSVYSKELAVFLGYENKQLMSDMTDWYDCADEWEYRTKNSGTDEINGVCVNFIGATTPEMIKEQFPDQAVGGGLASRIIFVYQEQKSQKVIFPFMQAEQEVLFEELRDTLEEIHSYMGNFTWNELFLNKYADWYGGDLDVNSNIRQNPKFAGYIQRRQNHLIKMCMIISASSRDDMVMTGEVFDRAFELLKRTEKMMPKTFRGYGQARNADLLKRVLEFFEGKDRVLRSELYQQFFYDIEDTEQLDKIIDTMKTLGVCDVRIKGGKTTLVIKENDLI